MTIKLLQRNLTLAVFSNWIPGRNRITYSREFVAGSGSIVMNAIHQDINCINQLINYGNVGYYFLKFSDTPLINT